MEGGGEGKARLPRAPAVSSPWAGWNLGLTRTWCRTYICGLLGDADLLMRRIGQPEAKQVSGERLQDMVGGRDGRPRESTGPRVLVVGCPPSPGPEGRQGQCSCVEEAGRSGHMSRYIRRRPLHAVCPRSELFTEGTDGAAAQKNGWGGERCRRARRDGDVELVACCRAGQPWQGSN